MEDSLYLECSAGISGDMVVAALLDAGASEQKLCQALDSLALPGFTVEITRVKKAGLDACDFNVVLDRAHDGHDHDMEYLYGRSGAPAGGQTAEQHGSHGSHGHHGHQGQGDHGSQHDHHDGHHDQGDCDGQHAPHEHRGLADICGIIEKSAATPGAKSIAKRVFEVLADAEAQAHGTTREEVRFHEVGAIDSIVDILAAAVCLDDLAPRSVIVTRLCEGQGMVRCQHGVIPVPVPAVVNIAAACGLRLSIINVQGELVTPTGAAFVAAVRTSSELPAQFTIKRVGIGAGKRVYPETSGILRAFVINSVEGPLVRGGAQTSVVCDAEQTSALRDGAQPSAAER